MRVTGPNKLQEAKDKNDAAMAKRAQELIGQIESIQESDARGRELLQAFEAELLQDPNLEAIESAGANLGR